MTQAETTGLARHGGRLDEAMRLYPAAPQPWIDLSTGINPRRWTPPAGLAVDAAPLPAMDGLAGLESAAARFFGVEPARVAAVPGSEIALRLLPSLGLPRPIVARRPCYGTHADVADAMHGAGVTVLVANPNNPDGRWLDPAALLSLRPPGGWLVVDEAFADTSADAGIGAQADDRIVVLRSFGKFFGLAGVRLGFVIGPPEVVAATRRLLGDWPVSAHAIAWGRAAYADADWIAGARRWLGERSRALDALLGRHGLSGEGASPLFRLVRHKDAPAIFARLAAAGILVRPFVDQADWLRFGLPADDAAMDRLDRALADG